jgi:hypothetical protein
MAKKLKVSCQSHLGERVATSTKKPQNLNFEEGSKNETSGGGVQLFFERVLKLSSSI